MFRRLHGFVLLAVIGLQISAAFAQAPSSKAATQPCDEACQQKKLDALFKAMDEAETSRRPKPSNSADCSAYDGHDLPDVLLDVCAKLKYVRSLPPGEASRFSCPHDNVSLVGASAHRIVSVWGGPDFVQDSSPPGRAKNDGQWTYFLGSAKPGWVGGGFAELTLSLVDGVVRKVDCRLAR
ncbi:hypothetical protein [Dyella subtropica]|uniref:hypothetical protein n=1 Tax=Dyella subtropica TaxID=2992127 RepID=UPI00225075A4|nr:hypothetical protein [Dyella subtropica]